jgi:hypothetical protein
MLIQSALTCETSGEEIAWWIGTAEGFVVEFLVVVALYWRLKASRVAVTFAVAANEGGVEVNFLEFLEFLGPDALRQVLSNVFREQLDYVLVTLTDCAEVSWVAFDFIAL